METADDDDDDDGDGDGDGDGVRLYLMMLLVRLLYSTEAIERDNARETSFTFVGTPLARSFTSPPARAPWVTARHWLIN